MALCTVHRLSDLGLILTFSKEVLEVPTYLALWVLQEGVFMECQKRHTTDLEGKGKIEGNYAVRTYME